MINILCTFCSICVFWIALWFDGVYYAHFSRTSCVLGNQYHKVNFDKTWFILTFFSLLLARGTEWLMIYFSIKFVRGACRARLCARNYGSIAVSDVGIADTKSIRDIGSLRKGGSRWQPQQPQSAPTWWKLVARICWKCKSYEEWESSAGSSRMPIWVQPVHKGFATELGYQNRWLHTSTQWASNNM